MSDFLLLKTKNTQKNLLIADFEQNESLAVANEFLKKVSTSRDICGRRISDKANWKGFKLWWIYYEWIFVKYGLVYSQYETLFSALDSAEELEISVQNESLRKLIQYYAYASGIKITKITKTPWLKNAIKQTVPALLKLFMSILCLPFLIWKHPKYALFTSDYFSPHGKFDFRKKNIYQEFSARQLRYVEFIRTLHPPSTLLRQFFKRRRPVLYLEAMLTIFSFLDDLAEFFQPAWKQNGKLPFETLVALSVVKRRFWRNKGEILFLKIMLQLLGVRTMMIASLSPRTLHLMVACKLTNVKVVGIMHGVSMRSYVISEFMENLESDYDQMSNDVYGVWSEGWIDYFNTYSKVLKKDRLQVSGFLRFEPLQKIDTQKYASFRKAHQLNVLWVSEPLLDFNEAEPYLEALLNDPTLHIIFKVRPNRDIVLETLREKRNDLLEKMTVMDCPIDEAIVISDVVVGSNSTGVLDALRYDKPIVTFKTRKWGDYFDLVSYHQIPNIYSENEEDFLNNIHRAHEIPKASLQKLKYFFFDIQERDGGKWIVDRMQEYANNKY